MLKATRELRRNRLALEIMAAFTDIYDARSVERARNWATRVQWEWHKTINGRIYV